MTMPIDSAGNESDAVVVSTALPMVRYNAMAWTEEREELKVLLTQRSRRRQARHHGDDGGEGNAAYAAGRDRL
jgi:hypothetical protein